MVEYIKTRRFALPLLSQNLTGMLFAWMFRILTAVLWGGGSREAFPCQ